jgi:chromosome transmission fidelity protein 1
MLHAQLSNLVRYFTTSSAEIVLYADYTQIVTLPYPLLLQKAAREALNLSLRDHIIIIDEAHNLMDAITGIYSISVSLSQFQRGNGQLKMYLQKFRNRLKGKNRVYVTQTVRLLNSLVAYLEQKLTSDKDHEGLVPVGDLMSGQGVDQINLFKLTRYLQESKLARKVDGYILHTEEEAKVAAGSTQLSEQQQRVSSHGSVPVLTHIQNFLLALMNPSVEGRFVYSKAEDDNDLMLRYMLLDPTHHFKEIVEEARAVVLAGGTMSPMDDYTKHLFSYLPSDQIMTISCGHVIPPSNLLAWPVTRNIQGGDFNFTFSERNSMINSTGQTLLHFIHEIPDGVVVFFPSYAYLNQCVSTWRERPRPGSQSVWDQLSSTKPIFLEPRSGTSATNSNDTKTGPAATEALLTAYSNEIMKSADQKGALLFSVIGGSLSEGINFSDRLGRAVIVVGLPFPNINSPEWKAKMEYIAQKAAAAKGGNQTAGKAAASDFYENATMRAVNQAVGRAIRHKDDYAAILLIDRRYGSDRIKEKLPGWIKGSLRAPANIDNVSKGLKDFFASKKG